MPLHKLFNLCSEHTREVDRHVCSLIPMQRSGKAKNLSRWHWHPKSCPVTAPDRAPTVYCTVLSSGATRTRHRQELLQELMSSERSTAKRRGSSSCSHTGTPVPWWQGKNACPRLVVELPGGEKPSFSGDGGTLLAAFWGMSRSDPREVRAGGPISGRHAREPGAGEQILKTDAPHPRPLLCRFASWAVPRNGHSVWHETHRILSGSGDLGSSV